MSEETTTVDASTKTTTTSKRARKPKSITVQNMRGGKLILNGYQLEADEKVTLDAKYLADKKKKNIVDRCIRMGLLKKV